MKYKPKKLKSINRVLPRYFIVLTVLLIIFVEVVCFLFVKSANEDKARERLVSAGSEITSFINGKSDEAVSLYLKSYQREGINASVISLDGKILLPIEDEGTIWDGSIEELLSKIDISNRHSMVLYTENHTMRYASGIEYKGESILYVSYSMQIMQGANKVLLIYFVIIGIVGLSIAVLISYTVSSKLTDGLNNLSTTAVRFSKGDFGVNFANAEFQELADLSDTLNSVRDEVKKSGDFQRELLANVSHDLKTPLTMIKAYASMVQEISGDDPEKRNKHLQVIIDESDRLTELVNDILNVSKVSSNIDGLNMKVFNLTEFLYGIINKFDYLQETQNYKFMVDIDANLYTRADEEKIGQVVYNLLGNAVNYTGEDKTVFISLKKSLIEDRIKLTIKDTGKGIAEDKLPEIWDRYYRVKENHLRPVKGTGLGLSIVKKILQNHKFDFGVNSKTGKGCEFWVDFPAVSDKIEVQPALK